MAEVFVFGSNLAGRHGAGSALEAVRNHGAKYGIGVGRYGNSYAIPTKDGMLKRLGLLEISLYVQDFIEHAKRHPEDDFIVVKVGCGLAGYEEEQISPMFNSAPENCVLPQGWRKILLDNAAHFVRLSTCEREERAGRQEQTIPALQVRSLQVSSSQVL